MRNTGTQPLQTERFLLRRFVEEDYYAMYHKWAKHEEVARYFPWNPMSDIESAKEKMSKWVQNYSREDYYHWGIACKEDGNLIGTINLKIDEDNNSAETSYIVAPDVWNKGVMTEVLKKVISFGFEILQLNRIAAEFFEGNEASRRVMEKCGMKIEGTARQMYCKDGRYIDSTWCSILYDEYKGR